MCYITRRIFPCCNREYWYSEPIPQQCTGFPRCISSDCIILGRYAEVVERGRRCWRCIMKDMRSGKMTGVSAKVLREAQKREKEHSGRVLRETQRLEKENSGAGGVDERRGEGRKRPRVEEIMEESGAGKGKGGGGHPERKRRRGSLGYVRSGLGKVTNGRRGTPSPKMAYTPPESSHVSNHPQMNPLNLTMPLQEPTTRLRAQTATYVVPVPINHSQDLVAKQDPILQHNASLNFDFDISKFPDMDGTIDPMSLMNWNWDDIPTGTSDAPLPLNSTVPYVDNANWSSVDQTALPFDQQNSSWLPTADEFFWQNQQFAGPSQHSDVQVAQGYAALLGDFSNADFGMNPEIGLNQVPDSTVGPNVGGSVEFGSIPLGNPFLFQSESNNFEDSYQWPEFDATLGEENYEAAPDGLDEQTRQQLDNILFGV